MTMEILKVQDLCKTYGKGEAKVEALKKVSLSLDKGEFAAVVGESGSGKSTLLNCIGALDTPTSGHIWIDEQDLFSMKEEQCLGATQPDFCLLGNPPNPRSAPSGRQRVL